MNAGLERVIEGYRAYLLDLGVEEGVVEGDIAALIVAEVTAEYGDNVVLEAQVVTRPSEINDVALGIISR